MFSEPAVGEKFFGRNEVLELLNKRASALKDGYRQNIALTGQCLAGKSSIILHFLSAVKDEGFIPIYVEVVREPFRSFSNKFIATMLYNAFGRMGERVDIYMNKLLEKAQKSLPKTFQAIKRVNASIERQDFDAAYSDLLGLTSVLKEETLIPCIVMLDEFDNLEHLGVKNPFLSFGKVIMVQKDTMYIVSSSRDEAIKKILSEKLSLLFGNFEIVKVSNFDFRASLEFIDMKLAGFDMEEALKKFLIAFTDGNAFYLDKLAGSIKAEALERMTSYIDCDIAAHAIYELIYSSTGVIHQYLLSFMLELLDSRYRDDYMSVLVSIASGQNKKVEIARSLKVKQGEVSKSLARLAELGLISRNGVFYKMNDLMLTFWLKFVYQRRKEMLVDGSLNKRELFVEDIKSYISDFISEAEKDAVSRIAELANLFSNELVFIDLKNLRLPHFTKVELKAAADARQFVACSFKNNLWLIHPCESYVNENDIVDYIRNAKALVPRVSNKIIIPLKGIDENARLLAKELKISIWDRSTINMLFSFYGKKGIVIL